MPGEIWRSIEIQLRATTDTEEANFFLHSIRPSHILGTTLVLEVSSRFALAQVDSQFGKQIQQALMKLYGPRWTIRWRIEGPRLIALVGPPGVGKTLVLKKWVSALVSRSDYDTNGVHLASLDKYHLGSPQTLETFSMVAGCRFVSTSLPVAEWGHPLGPRDTLFVDLAGGSARSVDRIRADKESLSHTELSVEAILVLPASWCSEELFDITNLYRDWGLVGVVFTQLDLTRRLHHLKDILKGSGLPLVAVSKGEELPGELCWGEAAWTAIGGEI